jgi:hypothetical protein
MKDHDKWLQVAVTNGLHFGDGLGSIDIYGRAALRAKIGPDEAEPEGCGGSTVEGENEVWPDLRRNPEGRGHFSSSLRRSSLADTRYALLLAPRPEKKWLPSLPTRICRYTLKQRYNKSRWDSAGRKHLCNRAKFSRVL